MKHLKSYENTNEDEHTKPQIGDYVICKDSDNNELNTEFLNFTIGKILNDEDNKSRLRHGYNVEYQNILPKFSHCFNLELNKYKNDKGYRYMLLDEILYWSPNINDLDPIINIYKYNL